jgi:serine/threonine protein kinase
MIALSCPEQCDFLKPARAPDELGRLGPYRVLEVLGTGGMGVVFRAEDVQLRRPVALKVLRPSLAGCAAARRRFLHEARAAAAVEDDHVVPIWQVGKDRGFPFLAMPLLRGESLDRRLDREGVLPLAEVLRIGRQTARGLAAAHARGLIHCDVKPSNLWLEGEPGASATGGRVKILDFGLARIAGDVADGPVGGTVAGTPSYMAPEQSRGGEVDGRTDLFALGCVLYRMATGELPFQGSDSISTLIVAAVDPPRPPIELNPQLGRMLSDLVLRLLAKDPAERPPSAEAAAQALEAIEREATASRPRHKHNRDPHIRLRWPSLLIAAVVLLLAGRPGSRPGPVQPGSALPPKGPDCEAAGRTMVVPAAHAEESPRDKRPSAPDPPAPAGMVSRQVDLAGVVHALEQRRDAVGLDVLRARADLEALDVRLRAWKTPADPQAVEADAEVGALRTRIQQEQAVLDEYRSRGLDLHRPTPMAAARALADLQPRLEQRVKQVEENQRAAADSRDVLQQARLRLAGQLEALRKVYKGLQADLERLKTREANEDLPCQRADRR